MSDKQIKTATVVDIIFDVTRDSYIKGDDGTVYPCVAGVAKQVAQLAFSELRRIVGNVARIESGMVVGFVQIPRGELETVGGGADDAGPLNETDRAVAASAKQTATPATIPSTGDRVKLDRYGCAVAWEHDALYVFPVDVRGAIEPIGSVVTKPSPEFLADVNAALHCSLTLEDFPASVVRERR